MTYCVTCQRHLNGAFSCAGCGTPSHELLQVETSATGNDPVSAPEFAAGAPAAQGQSPGMADDGRYGSYGGGDVYGVEHGVALGEGQDDERGAHDEYGEGEHAPVPAGRRGRRARKQPWRRRRIAGMGLVLGAGLVTLGVTGLTSEGALRLPSPGFPSDDSDESGHGDGKGGGVDGDGAGNRRLPPAGESGTDAPSGSPSPSASSSVSAQPSDPAGTVGDPDGSPATEPSTATTTGSVTTPPDHGPSHTPEDPEPSRTTPADPPSEPPRPTEEPPPPCDRFLWWCT